MTSKVDRDVVAAIMEQVRAALAQTEKRPVIVGLCGPQGSGKTTLAAAVRRTCLAEGLRAATLSLDDLYLTQVERRELAMHIHPLLATRGVPGTHDVALGFALIDGLRQGLSLPLPRFDKLHDDRAPRDHWQAAPARCQVLLFEGWCVGALPQPAASLAAPVNVLEEVEDSEAVWRTYVNNALAGAYQSLFARLDRLVLLAAPDFEVVHGWRFEQERELVDREALDGQIMHEMAIARFISHYERLTRHILSEMPERADLVVRLNAQRRPLAILTR